MQRLACLGIMEAVHYTLTASPDILPVVLLKAKKQQQQRTKSMTMPSDLWPVVFDFESTFEVSIMLHQEIA